MTPSSEELLDEIEALNSIYGDGTLSSCPASSSSSSAQQREPNTYILVLPPSSDPETDSIADVADSAADLSSRISLRLSFPPTYPSEEKPRILGTHSSGATSKPGEAARALDLFREAVDACFVPGTVCLFDALEEFASRRAEAAAAEPSSPSSPSSQLHLPGHNATNPEPTTPSSSHHENPLLSITTSPPPAWALSTPYTELKSTFLARAATVSSPHQAQSFISHLLATDKRARSATHNITAWRIRGGEGTGTSYQDCDDDGESAAGGRVLRLLQMMGVWDVVVVVTRWFGGVKMGSRRFAVINAVAREAVVRLKGEEGGGGEEGRGVR